MIVTTEHSAYEITDNRIRRVPSESDAATLRHDLEDVDLLDIIMLEVDKPAVFLIQLPGVEGPTLRRTTLVKTIEP